MFCRFAVSVHTATYAQLAKDWIDDKDVGGCKTLKYYMKVVK